MPKAMKPNSENSAALTRAGRKRNSLPAKPGKRRTNLTLDADAVEGLLRLVEKKEALNEVFNIGSTEEVSILRLAELVREQAGSSSEIQRIPYGEAYAAGFEDMMRRVPDVSKLERLTGFRPRTPLSQIVADVVADQRGRAQGVAGTWRIPAGSR